MHTEEFAADPAEMIHYCEERDDRMTSWERGFIDSVHNQIGEGRILSAKQIKTLNKIWAKVGN